MSNETAERLTPLSADEALMELKNYFLGEEWYIVDPLSGKQCNAIIVDEIKRRYKGRKTKPIHKELKLGKLLGISVNIDSKNRW